MTASQIVCSIALIVALTSNALAEGSSNQAGSQDPQAPLPATPNTTFTVTVVGTTPLVGVDIPIDQVAAPVQTLTGRAIDPGIIAPEKMATFGIRSQLTMSPNG